MSQTGETEPDDGEDETPQEFCFGTFSLRDRPCPWAESGIQPSDEERSAFHNVSMQYDTYAAIEAFESDGGDAAELDDPKFVDALTDELRERGYIPGLIDEETARECWSRAIVNQDGENAEAGRAVAEALGWD